ncbi:MAG: hypothetical protein DSY82_02025 [Flavobacteriia bacterium]|nr:MAG: hypothetical protein DSY82_02025 [Flavobacteriia bacterium]
MKREFFYILLILFIISCKGKTNFEKPEDLIPEDQMVNIITDLCLAQGATTLNNMDLKKSNKYVFLVYDKYGVDSTRFASSNLYYASKPEEYKKIFTKAYDRLGKMRNLYTSEGDSILKRQIDSVNRLKMKDKVFRPRE